MPLRSRSAGLAVVAAAATCLAVTVPVRPASRSAAAASPGSVLLSGKVTDASGHGWPLYATITVDGVPGGPFFTSPYNGKYTLKLPPATSYTLHVNANYPGYQEQSRILSMGSGNVVRNVDIGLVIDDSACTAPGYAFEETGVTQPFDGTSTPAGWTVSNNTPVGGWEFDDPHPRGNLTGGTGNFAIIDSDFLGIGNHEDTLLISPIFDFSAATNPVVSFDTDYRALASVADVDLSIDGGATWTNLWERTTQDFRGPSHVELAIPAAAGKTQVQVRFHYTGTWAWWWEVDNVFLGSRDCGSQAGGLVVGTVSRSRPSGGLVGASVTSVDQPNDNATTVATPQDAKLGDGFYGLFSSLTGKHPFTAALNGYSPQTKQVNVRENATRKAVFTLASGSIKTSPASISRTVGPQGTDVATLTVSNVGGASANVTLGINPAVSWLSLSQTTFTLGNGTSVKVTVSFDAATADVTGPGTYNSAITVTTDAPLAVPSVPVSMTVTP